MRKNTVTVNPDLLEKWMDEQCMCLRDLSRAVECSDDTSRKMLRGDPVARFVARKVAKAIGVPVIDLLVDDSTAVKVA